MNTLPVLVSNNDRQKLKVRQFEPERLAGAKIKIKFKYIVDFLMSPYYQLFVFIQHNRQGVKKIGLLFILREMQNPCCTSTLSCLDRLASFTFTFA